MKQTNEEKILGELVDIRYALEAIAIIMMQNQATDAAKKPIPNNLPFLGLEKIGK